MRIDQTKHCDRNPRVWLDGIELDTGDLLTADEEQGYVEVPIFDKDRIAIPGDIGLLGARAEGRVQITLDGAERPDEAQNV